MVPLVSLVPSRPIRIGQRNSFHGFPICSPRHGCTPRADQHPLQKGTRTYSGTFKDRSGGGKIDSLVQKRVLPPETPADALVSAPKRHK